MITPQLTEQYGQVDRVSVVRAILSSRTSANAGVRSKPSTDAAMPPIAVAFRNSLRVGSTDRPFSSGLAWHPRRRADDDALSLAGEGDLAAGLRRARHVVSHLILMQQLVGDAFHHRHHRRRDDLLVPAA